MRFALICAVLLALAPTASADCVCEECLAPRYSGPSGPARAAAASRGINRELADARADVARLERELTRAREDVKWLETVLSQTRMFAEPRHRPAAPATRKPSETEKWDVLIPAGD